MAISVGALRMAARFALAGMFLFYGWAALSSAHHGEPGAAPLLWPTGFICTYALCLASLVAFPRLRRTETAHAALMLVVLIGATHDAISNTWRVAPYAADLAGAYALLFPTFLERIRAGLRRDRRDPFTLAHPGERRAAGLQAELRRGARGRAGSGANGRAGALDGDFIRLS